jgi:hypothetical protein
MSTTITICASVANYKDAFAVQEGLEARGFTALMPVTAEEMRETGNFDVAEHKTWYDNPADFAQKTEYIKHHLRKIDEADAIVLANYEKDGISGYVGGNMLLELFYAWLHGKPAFLLYPVTDELVLYEEVMGLEPIVVNGDLDTIATELAAS